MGKIWGLILLATFGLSTQASVVAVVDTGVDLGHKLFSNRTWQNSLEIPGNSVDEDKNGYSDDINGWSFVDGSPKSFDPDLFAALPDDVYKLEEIMEKVQSGDVDSQELTWFREALKNQDLKEAFNFYMGISHGTHVAGISVKGNSGVKVMSVKFLGPPNKDSASKDQVSSESTSVDSVVESAPLLPKDMNEVWQIIASSLGDFAKEQGTSFAQMTSYVQLQADVANGSFGSSPLQPEMYYTFADFFQRLTGRMPSSAEYARMAKYYFSLDAEYIKAALDTSNTLFVFAAGNDTSDNDLVPTTPANHGSAHAITVAATSGRNGLADFSNFGATTVDVAAPGVDILSSAPGKRSYLKMSGTSQASPYVTNTALKLIDSNPSYFTKTLANRAQILKAVIVGTVDKKDWLIGKVVSAGIVNPARAVAAAKLLGQVGLEDALKTANEAVADLIDTQDLSASQEWSRLGMKPFVSKIQPSISSGTKIQIVMPVAGKVYPSI